MSNEKIKKLGNRKLVLGFGAMVGCIAIVFVVSLFPFVLDPSQIGTTEWWTNEIILVVLTIYSVIVVMFMGQTANASDERSNLAKARVRFNEQFSKIKRCEFEQWVIKVLQPTDQARVYKRILDTIGISQYDILSLNRSDIKSLVGSPQRVEQVWYDEITEKQYKTIIDIKNGKYNIKFVDPGYYLTDKHLDIEYTRSERALREQTKKTSYLVIRLISKILMVLLCGIVFGMFTKDLIEQKDTASSIMKLIRRLTNVASSSFVGYLTGCQENDINASYIEMKAETMKEQLNDTDFKYKTIEELAKEKFANRQKKEVKEIGKQEELVLLGATSVIHN